MKLISNVPIQILLSLIISLSNQSYLYLRVKKKHTFQKMFSFDERILDTEQFKGCKHLHSGSVTQPYSPYGHYISYSLQASTIPCNHHTLYFGAQPSHKYLQKEFKGIYVFVEKQSALVKVLLYHQIQL